jgi:hypothetical protein
VALRGAGDVTVFYEALVRKDNGAIEPVYGSLQVPAYIAADKPKVEIFVTGEIDAKGDGKVIGGVKVTF